MGLGWEAEGQLHPLLLFVVFGSLLVQGYPVLRHITNIRSHIGYSPFLAPAPTSTPTPAPTQHHKHKVEQLESGGSGGQVDSDGGVGGGGEGKEGGKGKGGGERGGKGSNGRRSIKELGAVVFSPGCSF